MLSAQDLSGIMAMMPAFATADAADINARETVAVNNLKAGVDRIIGAGINVIATTGSFGEFHTLLDDEWETLVHATVEVVNHRVPLVIGCTSLNSRHTVEKMRVVRDAGADGVLVSVPFYFPSTVDNAALGDSAAAADITLDITSSTIAGGARPNLDWRETATKIAIGYAGYVQPGPLRPPFVEIPEHVQINAQNYAAHWISLCEKYRPRVETARLARV